MLSKVFVSHCARGWMMGSTGLGWAGARARVRAPPLLARAPPLQTAVRHAGELLPPSQYDIPISPKFHLTHALVVYWELIPMFVVTCTALGILVLAIVWACKNKVDVIFTSPHCCNNISRTMDLRHPTVHKMRIIHQRYEPWPEMQDVLDKMAVAEHKAMVRATQCAQAS